MKWLLYTVILANIGFFVWHYQQGSSNGQVADTVISGSQLVLLSEYESRPTPEEEPAPEAQMAEVQSVQKQCLTLGPFGDEARMAKAQLDLKGLGRETFSYVTRDKLRDGFWVMLEATTSSEDAKRNLEKLKKAGLNEYFLILKGEHRHAISLGLFSKPELAKRRLESVTSKGFSPRIVQVTLPTREYWLEWQEGGAPPLGDEEITRLREIESDVGQTSRPCTQTSQH